ncbi:Protein CBG19528 [Caenorhabditis briggsae]|uniref:Protein CBG19528 n=1 Tax=Caenorhabditis briggsae TaxID=6238 RepID=A8XVT9_CAEBR|nr:Protein CBG19528 [Caenorhabditis briggsae]CAP36758.2 Protein CBG19528 [Caenorhabditis briggsae]
MATSPANDVAEDSQQYQILKIHSMQIEEASCIKFLVEWNGYEEKTWEPIECFEGVGGESGKQNPAIRKFLGEGSNSAKYRKMKNDIATRRPKKFQRNKEELFEISNLL